MGRRPGASVAAVTALFRYRGAGRALLRRLKYDGRDDLADPLGRALGRRFRLQRPEAATDRDLLLVPVPLHRWRQWRRGSTRPS